MFKKGKRPGDVMRQAKHLPIQQFGAI